MKNKNLINGHEFYNALLAGYIYLKNDKDYINNINVFPVADGDTGNNMVATVNGVIINVTPVNSFYDVINNVASESLKSARGNSGIIIAQFFNGLSTFVSNKPEIDIKELSISATKAVESTYKAVQNPVEGSILTVLKVWSGALLIESNSDVTIASILKESYKKAKEALLHTTEQLDILKTNKVVDAGARGFVTFLDGIYNYVINSSIIKNYTHEKIEIVPIHHEIIQDSDIAYRYCTEAYISGQNLDTNRIKNDLDKLGNSLIVVGNEKNIRIHIHTSTPSSLFKYLYTKAEIIEQKVDDMLRQSQIKLSRLSDIAIVTDSIADIPMEIKDKYQIHTIPQTILIDNREYYDKLTITLKELHSNIKNTKGHPTSSLPSIEKVKTYLSYLLDNYESILVLPVGKELSGTFNVMNDISLNLDPENEKIAVIDTCLNSAAQGLLVVETAKQIENGKSFKELIEFVNKKKSKSKILVSLNNIKYIVNSGRVSKLKGSIIEFLKLVPIISLDSLGRGVSLGAGITQLSTIKKIKRMLKKEVKSKNIERYVIVHSGNSKKAEFFSNNIENIIGFKPDYVTEISSIVGLNVGEDCVAIGYIQKS